MSGDCTRKALHMVGNAHLDPVWLWRWPEGLQAIRATFRSALDRMKETEGFVFTSSQISMYEWLEKTDPEMFEEIRERVKEGRWVMVGGWVVQPDCNIPSGESFVRHSLYGQRYLQEKFGVTAKVGYNVDSFGHNWGLPQILKRSGMDYYVFMRPNPTTEKPDLPSRLFYWEGPDGSRVLTYQIPYSYNSSWGQNLREKIEKHVDELNDNLPFLMCFYGVGNHGGGPTKENLALIAELAREAEKSGDRPEIYLSDPEKYFTQVEEAGLEIPVVKDDLQHHASGCYAAHSQIKRDNRKAEHALAGAEKLAVAAGELVGLAYPGAELVRAWKGVLFNQFHDIMAGTSIKEAYEDAKNTHGMALYTANFTMEIALQAISAKIDTQVEATPIVVWNHGAERRVGPVEIEFQWEWDRDAEMALVDNAGNEVPYQRITTSSLTAPGWRRAITFIADVPPLGYTVYWLYPRTPQAKPSGLLSVSETSLENDYVRVEFDPKNGYIARMVYMKDGWEVFSGPGAVPIVIEDKSDTWSHGIFRFNNVIGRFGGAVLEVVEQGPVRATLRVTNRYGSSSLIQEYSLYAGMPYLDVKTVVDWHEQHKALKLEFPVNVHEPKVTYEVQYGTIERPANGEEEPGLHWFDVSEGNADHPIRGLSILNDAKYSYDVDGNRMHLTVLRSPIFAHHDPVVPDPDGYYHYIDQGLQAFEYRLLPHSGDWKEARAPQQGYELNVPCVLLTEYNHEGSLPREWSLLNLSNSNVLLSAVKRAEDNNGTIVRVYEAYGVGGSCSFTWNGKSRATWMADFGPYEVKTFLVPDGENPQVEEVDLLERLLR